LHQEMPRFWPQQDHRYLHQLQLDCNVVSYAGALEPICRMICGCYLKRGKKRQVVLIAVISPDEIVS
jgi:hypothetical protein